MESYQGVRRIDSWKTPSGIPAGEQGDARVVIEKQEPGFYRFRETWGGWLMYEALDTFYYTNLQDRDPTGEWKTWMTDQPQWWFTLKDIAEESNGGHYLIGGLGLGIIVNHLVNMPERVKSVTVVENNPNIIDLVWPHIEKAWPFHIINADFFDFAEKENLNYDVVITDMWRGDRNTEAVKRMAAKTHFAINQRWPESQQFYHGMDRYVCDLGMKRINAERAGPEVEARYRSQFLTGTQKAVR